MPRARAQPPPPEKTQRTQALEIVTKPAPHLLADGVAEKIVEFVAGARGGSAERLAELDVEPPLLSVICRELNDRRRSLGQEKITADLVSGNRREILADFYERSVADLPAPMRAFVGGSSPHEVRLPRQPRARDRARISRRHASAARHACRPPPARIEDRLGLQRVELTHDVSPKSSATPAMPRLQRQALEEAREKERLALAAVVRQTRRRASPSQGSSSPCSRWA